jgi:hypothetical protein
VFLAAFVIATTVAAVWWWCRRSENGDEYDSLDKEDSGDAFGDEERLTFGQGSSQYQAH